METFSPDQAPSAALMFMVDPTAALRAAERASATCVSRRRHSIILGRLINDAEARRLDRQRDEEYRRESLGLGWSDDEPGSAH